MLRLSRFFSFYLETGVASLIGAGKKKGEDAYYTSQTVISVADGVGGWTLSGVDPSRYAWELMNYVKKEAEAAPERNAFEILNKSAEQCKEIGSSTCVLMVLDPVSGVADTINVGDSGFFVYRMINGKLELVVKSQEVLHGFNFPFQLGTEGDQVSTGDKKKVNLMKDDWVLAYSDGFSDNLFEDHIRNLLEKAISDGVELNPMADSFANIAKKYSTDDKYLSPFAKAASVHYVQRYLGGKPDDITVVVAKVCQSP